MEERAQENKMGVMPVKKLLINMSLPMMISMFVQAMYNIVDSIFVARISENALTAVSLIVFIPAVRRRIGLYLPRQVCCCAAALSPFVPSYVSRRLSATRF